jgi:YHS domain-containing protein
VEDRRRGGKLKKKKMKMKRKEKSYYFCSVNTLT